VFADGMTILAEHAIRSKSGPTDTITGRESKDAEEATPSRAKGEGKRVERERLDHLNEMKAALKI